MNWKRALKKISYKNWFKTFKSDQFYEVNREVIINQEEQKLNEIELLKKRLDFLKNELNQVGKIDSKTSENDELQLLSKSYNNSQYYKNQIKIENKTIEQLEIEKIEQDISQNINNDFFNLENELIQQDSNFQVPYNIEERDVADEDLILPSYSNHNTSDI